MLVQIGLAVGLAYVFYERLPYIPESFMFVFPGLVLGNFANLVGAPYVHFVWVAGLFAYLGYRLYLDRRDAVSFYEPLWLNT